MSEDKKVVITVESGDDNWTIIPTHDKFNLWSVTHNASGHNFMAENGYTALSMLGFKIDWDYRYEHTTREKEAIITLQYGEDTVTIKLTDDEKWSVLWHNTQQEREAIGLRNALGFADHMLRHVYTEVEP